MPLPVSLKAVTEVIDAPIEGWTTYIHRQTGEIVGLPTSSMDVDEEDFAEDVERVEADDAFIELPSQRDFDEYRIMARFVDTVDDERIRERLEDAIEGKGAFSRFKSVIAKVGLREAWFDYKLKACARQVRFFLTEQKIAFLDDVGLEAMPTDEDDA